MKHMFKAAAFAATVIGTSLVPGAIASAQTLQPAVIIVVDMDAVFNNSAAGKQAQVELKGKIDALQARANTLRTQFAAEEDALGKSRPTAATAATAGPAWEAKARDYQTRRQAAETELGQREKDVQASRQYVIKQISDATSPIITAIMRERGATLALPEGATLQHAAALEVTTDVVARLDKSLPRVSTAVPAGAK
jgi:outer membrane protein